jgi:hypothetical protein
MQGAEIQAAGYQPWSSLRWTMLRVEPVCQPRAEMLKSKVAARDANHNAALHEPAVQAC